MYTQYFYKYYMQYYIALYFYYKSDRAKQGIYKGGKIK